MINMKIIKLVKSEFLKHYNIKKLCIITLIMFISSVLITEFTNLSYTSRNFDANRPLYEFETMVYESLSQKEDLTLEEQFKLYKSKIYKEISQFYSDKHLNHNDWRFRLINELAYALEDNYAIQLYQENKDDPTIQLMCNTNGQYDISYFYGKVYYYCNYYTESELEELSLQNEQTINDYTYILRQDKFYLYAQYLKETGKISENNIKLTDTIIALQIESMDDYRALNYMQTIDMIGDNIEIVSKKEFIESSRYYDFKTYRDYVRYYVTLNKSITATREIILYSTEHNIKHDIPYNVVYNFVYTYMTSKTAVNQIFHLALIVLVIVSITSSSIVSKEHNTGTIKNIITTPVKRWKILLSKFIYLILHTYIVWMIGLFILSIYAGIRFGFHDLFTPKLIYTHGHVIEINYYLYLVKELLITSIPLIAFLSILFFLSTVTLSATLTTSVTTILGIICPVLYFICADIKSLSTIFVNTPFMYFDYGFIFGKQEWYIGILKQADISLNRGIIISLITTAIFYIITNIVYIRRDIKN